MNLALILVFSVLAVLFSIIRRVYAFSAGKNLFGEELESKYQRIFTQITNNKNIINVELWTLIVLCSAVSLTAIDNYVDSWAAVFAFALFISMIFIYLANYQPRNLSINIAKAFSGIVIKMANVTKKYLKFIPPASKNYQNQSTNQVYEKSDLIDFFQRQSELPNNKISDDLLKLLSNMTERNDYQAADMMTNMKKVKKIDSEQEIGPVVIDELHKTGNKYFLVEDKKQDELIGYIKLRDLTSLKSSGKIRGAINKELEYVETTDELMELIETFLTSSCPIFLVRDSGETVGVITIDECLEKLLF